MTPKLPRPRAAATVLALLLPVRVAAQAFAPARTLASVTVQLDGIHPGAKAFKLSNYTLTRAGTSFILTDGMVWPLEPHDGRVFGVVWQGAGRMRYDAPTAVEGERLSQLVGSPRIDTSITGLVLLFADSTLEELRQAGGPDSAIPPPSSTTDLTTRYRDLLRSSKTKVWSPTLVEPLLNGRRSDMFYALIRRGDGDDLDFEIDPDSPEQVSLSRRRDPDGFDPYLQLVNEFPQPDRAPAPHGALRRQVTIDRYVMDVRLPGQFDGSVGFSASATLTLRAPSGGYGPWIPFGLAGMLNVDSATWDGTPTHVYKEKDSGLLWVRAPAHLDAGTTAQLSLWFQGDLFDRYGDWFFPKTYENWYPRPLDEMAKSAFDVTYHAPIGYPVGSVGELRDTSVADRVVTTHWVHETPIRNFAFNIGRYKTFDASVPGSPPVTLLWSDAGHRSLATGLRIPLIGNVRQVMTDEIASAMKFFTTVYGPPIEPRFYVAETPEGYGEAFPGMVHLSFATFIPANRPGADQVFRAHEVAHQWWGIGVDYASYRDRWLSEGLAEFSGTWYMQTRLGNLDRYLDTYRETRRDILAARDHLGATSLGQRIATARNPNDYQYGVYDKGAWTMHMLRVLLLRLSDMNEDRFTGAMREFYSTYKGRSASTDDLRRVMEKYAGTDLGWFFHEWIDGTAIPTYDWAWKAGTGTNGQPALQIRVRQSNVPDDFQMYVPIAVELKDGRTLRTRVHVAGPLTETQIPLPGEVKNVRFNELEGVLAEVRSVSY